MAISVLGTPTDSINGTSTTLSAVATGPTFRGNARAGTQIILRGTGGAALSVILEGCETDSPTDTDWYPIFAPPAFAGDRTDYVLLDEPHAFLRTRLTAYAGGALDTVYVPFYGARG